MINAHYVLNRQSYSTVLKNGLQEEAYLYDFQIQVLRDYELNKDYVYMQNPTKRREIELQYNLL
jgi:hypothetical protein